MDTIRLRFEQMPELLGNGEVVVARSEPTYDFFQKEQLGGSQLAAMIKRPLKGVVGVIPDVRVKLSSAVNEGHACDATQVGRPAPRWFIPGRRGPTLTADAEKAAEGASRRWCSGWPPAARPGGTASSAWRPSTTTSTARLGRGRAAPDSDGSRLRRTGTALIDGWAGMRRCAPRLAVRGEGTVFSLADIHPHEGDHRVDRWRLTLRVGRGGAAARAVRSRWSERPAPFLAPWGSGLTYGGGGGYS